MRITGNGGTIIPPNQMLFTGNGGGYGHIRFRGSSENTMFFHDSNVTAFTGWFVGQSPTIFGAGVGTGFGIVRTTNGNISNNNGIYMLSNGFIGINTNAPNCPIGIGWYNSFTVTGVNTYFSTGATGFTSTGSGGIGLNVSLQGSWISCSRWIFCKFRLSYQGKHSRCSRR